MNEGDRSLTLLRNLGFKFQIDVDLLRYMDDFNQAAGSERLSGVLKIIAIKKNYCD